VDSALGPGAMHGARVPLWVGRVYSWIGPRRGVIWMWGGWAAEGERQDSSPPLPAWAVMLAGK
jgi:hypothetical protein